MNEHATHVSARLADERSTLVERAVARLVDADGGGPGAAAETVRCALGEHVDYLTDAVGAGTVELFVDYVAWAKVRQAHMDDERELERELAALAAAIRRTLAQDEAAAATRMIDEALERFPSLPTGLAEITAADAPRGALAAAYLGALLSGRRDEARAIVEDALTQGVPVRDLYLHVFQPSQREVGRLWQLGRISVAWEHYCTAATQLIISTLYDRVFAAERRDLELVATCVEGELHELGIRMVADFFEMAGWDSHYLGASVPVRDVAEAVRDRRADLFAVSATMTFHIGHVRDLVAAVRDVAPDVPILVGGYPFNRIPDLAGRVGADATAIDAAAAVAAGERLSKGRKTPAEGVVA